MNFFGTELHILRPYIDHLKNIYTLIKELFLNSVVRILYSHKFRNREREGERRERKRQGERERDREREGEREREKEKEREI